MAVGEKIKKCRIELDMPQGQFAKELNISQSALSKYENGLRKPTTKTLEQLSKITKEPISYFMDEIESENDIKLPFFAYYQHKECKIVYSNEMKNISKIDFDLNELSDGDIRDNYFIYHINKDLSEVLRQGGLIIFEKLKPVKKMSELEDWVTSEKSKIILDDTGEVLRFKKGFIFTVDDDNPIRLDSRTVIGVAKYLLNVPL